MLVRAAGLGKAERQRRCESQARELGSKGTRTFAVVTFFETRSFATFGR